jgi:hypothetical protein
MKFLPIIIFFCFPVLLFAQADNEQNIIITVSGTAIDSITGEGLNGLMVLNRSTKTGSFGNGSGEFTVYLNRKDTLMFSVVGYNSQKISFQDSSVIKKNFRIIVKMQRLNMDLAPVSIFPEREFSEIKKEIDELGVDHHYQVEGLGAVFHPITYFYERFSRFEKQKRKAAELNNEENMKDILKELFRKYVKADIINLTEKEFENFIFYCNFDENFIKNASQYDLIMAIKIRYENFVAIKNMPQKK